MMTNDRTTTTNTTAVAANQTAIASEQNDLCPSTIYAVTSVQFSYMLVDMRTVRTGVGGKGGSVCYRRSVAAAACIQTSAHVSRATYFSAFSSVHVQLGHQNQLFLVVAARHRLNRANIHESPNGSECTHNRVHIPPATLESGRRVHTFFLLPTAYYAKLGGGA